MDITATDIVFYVLGLLSVLGAVGVLVLNNPIYAALSLATTMVALGGLFYNLGAFFVAGVQVIVYAGAVMVLFVMVMMLFDIKAETRAFSKGIVSGALKLTAVGLFLGLVAGAVRLQMFDPLPELDSSPEAVMAGTKGLARLIFYDYMFSFQALGALLLMIAIGSVALSRIRGGTHAE
jgi:NADH-quinone oxidoreductase subunit J